MYKQANNNLSKNKAETPQKTYFDDSNAGWGTTEVQGVDNPLYSNEGANGLGTGEVKLDIEGDHVDSGEDNIVRRDKKPDDPLRKVLQADFRQSTGILDMADDELSTTSAYDKIFNKSTTFGKASPNNDAATDSEASKPVKQKGALTITEEINPSQESGNIKLNGTIDTGEMPDMMENEVLFEDHNQGAPMDEKTTEL